MIEFEPSNIIALCWSCHWWWHKNPLDANEWLTQRFSKLYLEKLKLMAHSGAGTREYKMLRLYLKQQVK